MVSRSPDPSPNLGWSTTHVPARFASRGSDVRLFGYELKDGMFYIGSGLASVSSSQWPEPALIDPHSRSI